MVNVQEYSERFKEKAFSSRNVIVKRGVLPLIITAGHGGTDKPTSIPDRKQKGSLLLADMYTKEIAEGIGRGIQNHYENAPPHVIMNLISRKKADVNRSIEEGTETKEGEFVWNEYHNYVQEAVDCVLKEYNYGLMIDIHGNVM
jgi:N-formylglutamate amidohydrolase